MSIWIILKIKFFEGRDDPKMFQYNLVKRAKNTESILFSRRNDDRIIIATSRLLSMDVVDITILGNKKQIENKVLN
jgi:phosphate acetyltransferase